MYSMSYAGTRVSTTRMAFLGEVDVRLTTRKYTTQLWGVLLQRCYCVHDVVYASDYRSQYASDGATYSVTIRVPFL